LYEGRTLRTRRPLPLEEVADQLARRAVIAAAKVEGTLLPPSLECDAIERMDTAAVAFVDVSGQRVVARVDADDDAGVGIALGARYWLMPLVTTWPGSEVAATTVPPGHMQKL